MSNTPAGVLKSIAHVCDCSYDGIEIKLEMLNGQAGLMPRPIVRYFVAEKRLDEIRDWLGTPEAYSVVDQANNYVRQMNAP